MLSCKYYLSNAFKMLMTSLVRLCFSQISSNTNIFPQEDFTVVFKPIEHLLDIILKQP